MLEFFSFSLLSFQIREEIHGESENEEDEYIVVFLPNKVVIEMSLLRNTHKKVKTLPKSPSHVYLPNRKTLYSNGPKKMPNKIGSF